MQELLDKLGDNAWILFLLAITVFSWVAGKLKEWTQRNAGVNKPASPQPQPVRVHDDDDEEEEEEEAEERAVDLAALLGLTPPREQRPKTPPRTAGPPRTASPPAQPAPGPPPIARPVDRVPSPAARPKPPTPVAKPAPAPTLQLAPADPVVEPTTPSARRSRRARFGRLSRPELRRAIILAEVLDKPLAMRDESV